MNDRDLARLRHDLRTPLNAIIGYSEMLLDELPDGAACGEAGERLQRVHAAGHELLQLVEQTVQPRPDGDGDTTIPASFARAAAQLLDQVEADCAGLSRPGGGAYEETDLIVRAARRMRGMLPRAIGESPADPQPVAAEPDSATTTPASETPRNAASDQAAAVLVVDDEAVNRDLLKRRLERDGHLVFLASGGDEALRLMRERQFDLVLLDVMMPGMDGRQVLREMKDDPALRHLPVLMVSALTELESVVRCIELGAEDYLPKPFNPVLLQARIGACLDKKRLRDREVLHLQRIEEERRRADSLLRVILPDPIVDELKRTDAVRPRHYSDVAVLFCDIVGFTPYCERHDPEELIGHLQRLVETFEELSVRHRLQKIKTIGDSFMATAGLLETVENPVLAAVACGLEMLDHTRRLPTEWTARVGIHVGPVVAGVVGRRHYLFDLWGDTVNTAARVERHGKQNAVNVSRTAWERVAPHCVGRCLGPVELKGKGEMELWHVLELRAG